MVLRALHLCSGYGGFELALRGIARTVAHVERDAYAAATLVARMDEALLDQAPIWSDLCTFDTGPWRGRVDIITAGFPCQPFSAAGKRLGTDDDRWLWPDIARIIRDVGPRYVFLENVPGVVRAGLAHVLGDLADLGFNAEWGLLAASAVGAPHKRERFWLVAHAQSGDAAQGLSARHRRPDTDGGCRWAGWSDDVADAESPGQPVQDWPSGPGQKLPEPGRSSADVAHAQGEHEREPHRQARPESREHARPDIGGLRFPPPPNDHDGWADWLAQGGPEPGVRRGADGPPPWLADALHLGGNGLVPQAARAAWELLTERGGW